MSLSYSLIEHFEDHEEPTESGTNQPTTEAVDNSGTTESQEDCMTRCQEKCSRTPDENELDEDETTAAGDDATTSSLDIEDGSNGSTSEATSGASTETFSNMNNLNVSLNTGRSLWSLDLLLKSILFACLFYVLAHSKTRATVTKFIVRGKENVSYVLMLVFALVYYLLHLVV